MRNQSFHLASWAMFIALLCLLTFTPIGFIPLGPIKATIVHLPVILMGMIFGIHDGIMAGFCFGLASLVSNTMMPGVLSFAFTPFVEVAGIGGNIYSLIICFLPRIILGLTSGYCGRYLSKRNWMALSAFGISLLHSILVLGLIFICFKDEYALIMDISSSLVLTTIFMTFLTQSMVEAILAMAFIFLIYPLIQTTKGRHLV